MRPDFKNPKSNQNSDQWYDVELDKTLIEQSIAKQYGVLPSEQGNLIYSDWAKMVSGLMDDTPLGRVVSIRMENDPSIIKNFTPHQKAIQAEWRNFRAKQTSQNDIAQLEIMIASMFGGGGTK